MKQGKWIWYPGEWELDLANRMLFRRDYRGIIEPPFWKIDGIYCNVFFEKELNLARPARVRIHTRAVCSVIAKEGFIRPDEQGCYTLPAGEYTLTVTAYGPDGTVPVLRIDGDIVTDESWTVRLDRYRGKAVSVGYMEANGRSPYDSLFECKEILPEKVERRENVLLCDFGRETFGYLRLRGITEGGAVTAYYGESREEALAFDLCETLDCFEVSVGEAYTHSHSRGFRYVAVTGDASFADVSLVYEYLPIENRGAFRCSDETVNEVYRTALYTFHLCSRETFLDGLKRDRWYWGGDAYQSFLYNYYTFFDRAVNERTLWALRGKDPVTLHVNHIMDYTFYWFISLADYLLYQGETPFLRSIWPRAVSLMEYCLKLRNQDGFLEGREPEDWVFLDWAPIDNRGVVSAEQLLFVQALRSMALLAGRFASPEEAARYERTAEELRQKTFEVFYDEESGVFRHHSIDGIVQNTVTRYASVFAINYGMLDDSARELAVRNVLENDEIPQIVTPYAKFYEVVSLCEAGRLDAVRSILDEYWGGMVRLGATTFWELYDPRAKDHLSMYGRPFGKSLCHAWGSCPLYLVGRYFLGVVPTDFGYSAFRVTPRLGGFKFIEGKVPTPSGEISVYLDEHRVEVRNGSAGEGELILDDGRVLSIGAGERVSAAL